MPHPIVHAEIRSTDPDATRKFFADLLGWTYPDPGAVPGYTFVDTGVPGALYTAISPLQGGSDLVTFFIAVDDIDGAVKRAGELGGQVVQEELARQRDIAQFPQEKGVLPGQVPGRVDGPAADEVADGLQVVIDGQLGRGLERLAD